MSVPEVLLVNSRILAGPSGGQRGGFVLKCRCMNPESQGIAAALARAWRAIVRAFTPTGESRGSQNDGADTTLFGGAEPPRTGRGRATKDDFWDPTGTSTDFADPDPTGDTKRR